MAQHIATQTFHTPYTPYIYMFTHRLSVLEKDPCSVQQGLNPEGVEDEDEDEDYTDDGDMNTQKKSGDLVVIWVLCSALFHKGGRSPLSTWFVRTELLAPYRQFVAKQTRIS